MTNAVAQSTPVFARHISRDDSMAHLINRWNEQGMFGTNDDGNNRTVREYADMCGYTADDGSRYGQAVAYLDNAHEVALWDDQTRHLSTSEVAVFQLTWERDNALARAAHMEAGLDAVTAHHDSFIAHLRTVAADYAQHGEWCSVYEQAMSDLGVNPLSLDATITLQITVDIPVHASRRQRANADTSFVNRSYAYNVRDYIAEALNDVTFFDSDYSIEEGSIEVTDVDCINIVSDEDA